MVVRPASAGQIPPRGSDRSPLGHFGCKSRQVRSTLAGVGSFQLREKRNRATIRLGVRVSGDSRLDKPDGEKLNHERPGRACR